MRARDSRRSKPLASNSAASRSASAWLRRRRGAALTCSSLIPLLNHEAHCAYRWFGLTDTAHKRSRLEFLGNCPYGYRLAADRKHIEPDRAEQAVLKRIRKLRADGLSLQAVAVELNRRKLTTRQGSPWRMEYVARIEKREASGAIAPLR